MNISVQVHTRAILNSKPIEHTKGTLVKEIKTVQIMRAQEIINWLRKIDEYR